MSLQQGISNELNDELSKVTMDVTSSFLNGRISSPLVSYALSYTSITMAGVNNALYNTAALQSAGLYITKDGINFDQSVGINIAETIVKTTHEMVKQEFKMLENMAIQRLTYIPDLSYITNRVSYNFLKYVALDDTTHVDSLNNTIREKKKNGGLLPGMSDGSTDAPEYDTVEETEKAAQNKTNKTLEGIKKFAEDKIIPTMKDISYIADKVSMYSSEVTKYVAFGPEWVNKKILDESNKYFKIAEDKVTMVCDMVDEKKMEGYAIVADELSKTMCTQYDAIKTRIAKMAENKRKAVVEKLKKKAEAEISDAKAKVEAKTGVHLPLPTVDMKSIMMNAKNAEKITKMLSPNYITSTFDIDFSSIAKIS